MMVLSDMHAFCWTDLIDNPQWHGNTTLVCLATGLPGQVARPKDSGRPFGADHFVPEIRYVEMSYVYLKGAFLA